MRAIVALGGRWLAKEITRKWEGVASIGWIVLDSAISMARWRDLKIAWQFNHRTQSKHRRLYTTSALSPHTLPYIYQTLHPHPHSPWEMSVELLLAVRGRLSWFNPTLHFALRLLLQPLCQPGFCIAYAYNPLFSAVACLSVQWACTLHRTSTGGSC